MNFKGFVFGKKTPEENLKLIETQSQQIVDDLRGLQEKINALPSAQSVGNYLSVVGDKQYSLDTVNCTNGDLLFLDKQKAKAQTTPASGLHVAYADEAGDAATLDGNLPSAFSPAIVAVSGTLSASSRYTYVNAPSGYNSSNSAIISGLVGSTVTPFGYSSGAYVYMNWNTSTQVRIDSSYRSQSYKIFFVKLSF